MHICFTTLNYPSRVTGGGRNTSLEYISKGLKELGHDVTIISTRPKEGIARADSDVYFTPPPRITPKSAGNIYQIYKATVELHRRKKIDLIHVCNREVAGLAGVLFKRKYNVPVAVWMNDLGFESQKFFIAMLRNPLSKVYLSVFYKVSQNIVLKRCDVITSIGPDITATLRKNKVYHLKTFDIGNTVDTERFSPKVDGTKIRKEFSIGDRPLVTSVGILNFGKGPDVFIKSAREISKVIKDARFLIVGSIGQTFQWYVQYLHELTENLGLSDKIIFTGVRYDVAEIMAASNCVVSLNRKMAGGISNVWLEAMASAIPLVTSKVASAEYVIRNYENGILVEEDNPLETAEAIIKILTDKELARKLGENARLTVLRNYSVEAVIDKLAYVYETMTKKA